jgi:hypothetical protein
MPSCHALKNRSPPAFIRIGPTPPPPALAEEAPFAPKAPGLFGETRAAVALPMFLISKWPSEVGAGAVSNYYYAILNPTGSATGTTLPGPFGPSTAGTATAGLAEAIAALAAVGGGVLYVQPGTYRKIDWTKLAGFPVPLTPVIQNIQFSGAPSSDGLMGSILAVQNGLSKSPTAAQVYFLNCIFENIAITNDYVTTGGVTGDVIFFGRSNANNLFRNVTFIDNTLHPLSLHGPNLWVKDCRFLQSATPPTAAKVDQPIFDPLGPFVCEGCEWNYAPYQSGSGICIGTNGGNTIDNGATGPWWILRNRFLDANATGYYIDAIVDIEPTGGSTPNTLQGLYIDKNIMYNGKVDIYQGDDIWITDNYHRTTSVNLYANGIEFVGSINSGDLPVGTIHIDRNHIVQDANTSATYPAKAISVLHNLIRELYIRDNWIVINAASTPGTVTPPVGAISIACQGPTSPRIDQIVIEGNTIGSSTARTTKYPAIVVAGDVTATGSPGTVNRLRVLNNRLAGAGSIPAIDSNPTTVNNAFDAFLQLGWPSWTTKILAAEVYDNNWEDAGGLAAAQGIALVGTLAPASSFIAAERNRTQVVPSVLTVLPPNGGPYVNAYGNAILVVFYASLPLSVLYRGGLLPAVSQGVVQLAPYEVVVFNWGGNPPPVFTVLPS